MGKKKGKSKEAKGKRERKKHPTKKKSEYYEIKEGKLDRKKPFCPRCGAGVFMAEHKERFNCGKCGYTEWKGKGDKK
jgi:small subunit ribosomal protein S27Ae